MDWFESILDFLIDRPVIMMAIMAIPFFVICRWKKCFPSKRLLQLSLIPLAMSFGVVFFSPFVYLALLLLFGLLAFAIFDLVNVAGRHHFRVTREIQKVASLGNKHHCLFTVANHGERRCWLELRDDLPNEFTTDIDKFEYELAARSHCSFEYQFIAKQRGRFLMRCIYLKVFSPFGLWQAFYSIKAANEIFVYPDMKQIAQYDLLARTDRLNLLGVRRSRKIGQDNNFERLRDYTQDDNYKHIDWRTTARRQKLTVKDFQENQSQRIVFMIDCGRMMTGQADGLGLFDQCLNAMLMLSYVALRQGDSVGLICFSDRVHRFIPPRAGVKHVNRLLHATFDQTPRFVESRYDEAFLYLRNHCQKRALVVLVTNVIDTINSSQILKYMSHLTNRHLPLAVVLRDHQMFDLLDQHLERPTATGSDRYYSAAAAANIVNWRQQAIIDLQHQGVMSLDVFPEQLTTSLINTYLEVKAKHLL